MPADIVLGIVTVIMALLGAAVSLHPPDSLHAPGKWGAKVGYASAFAVLGTIAIVCVIKQSRETAVANQNLSNALSDLERSTGDIASMTNLNTQLQERLLKQSDAITDLSKQSIAATTGGKTFCLVKAVPTPDNKFAMVIGTRGLNPLHSVHVQMIDVDLAKSRAPNGPMTLQDLTDFPEIPFLAQGAGRPVTFMPIDARDKRSITFNFFSLNGSWTEDLRLRRVNGQWEQAMRILKVKFAGQPMIPLYEWASEHYPKVNGKVDWTD
jgi:hypothetical protein